MEKNSSPANQVRQKLQVLQKALQTKGSLSSLKNNSEILEDALLSWGLLHYQEAIGILIQKSMELSSEQSEALKTFIKQLNDSLPKTKTTEITTAASQAEKTFVTNNDWINYPTHQLLQQLSQATQIFSTLQSHLLELQNGSSTSQALENITQTLKPLLSQGPSIFENNTAPGHNIWESEPPIIPKENGSLPAFNKVTSPRGNKEIASLRHELRRVRTQLQETQDELSALQIRQQATQYGDVELNTEAHIIPLIRSKNELKQNLEEIQEQHKKTLQDLKTTYEEQINNLTEQLEDTVTKNNYLQREGVNHWTSLDEMMNQVSQLKTEKKVIQENLDSNKTTYQKCLKDLEEDINTLNNLIKEKKEETLKLTQDNQKLHQGISDKTAELNYNTSLLTSANEALCTVKKLLGISEEEECNLKTIEALIQKKWIASNDLQTTQAFNTQISLEKEQLQESQKRLQAQLDKKDNTIRDLTATLEGIQKKTLEATTQQATTAIAQEEQAAIITQLQQELSQASREKATLQANLSTIKKEYEQNNKIIQNIEKEIMRLQEALNTLQRLQEKNHELEQALLEQKTVYNTRQTNSQTTITTLKEALEQKDTEADRLKTELSSLQFNYNQLLEQQDFTQEESKKNNGQYQKKEQELQTALERAEQVLAETKAYLKILEAQIEHMLTEQTQKTTEQDKALKSLQAQYSAEQTGSESLTQTIETQNQPTTPPPPTPPVNNKQPPILLARIIIPQEESPAEESPVIDHPPTSHDLGGQLPFGHLLPTLINWVGNHPEQLTRTLAVKVQTLLIQDLGRLTPSSTETDADYLKTCQTQLDQLFEKLHNPLPIKPAPFIPRNWTKHPESQTESFLNYVLLDLSHYEDSSKIHTLFLEDTQILSQRAEKGSSKSALELCLNFSLLSYSSKPYHNPLEEKPKDSKSIQSLAHLLIAHAEIYPNPTIEIPDTPDAPKLITYLRAYEVLYKTLSVSLNFNLSSHVPEPTAMDITDIISDPEIRAWLSGRNQEEPQYSSYSKGSPTFWNLKLPPLLPQNTIPFLHQGITCY